MNSSFLLYSLKQNFKNISLTIRQSTVGRFLLNHGLDEIQNSPILNITKYLPQKDIRIFSPYKTESVILEIGTGNGEHLVRIAKDNTKHTIIGFELVQEYVKKTANNIMKNVCKNAKIVHGEAKKIIEKYIPNQTVDKIYIICPDPWPKKRHIKHRITYIENLTPLVKKLNMDGEIIVITDNEILAQTLDDSLEKYQKSKIFDIQFKRKKYSELPKFVFRTKYIKKWEKIGREFWYYSIIKVG
ncbi:MAG TPA: tRNA (guanosine(46)-N7)-methyltransferase TrmB [Candidatus Dojkabacteria bacterium]|nr:tRNA (guanosine(46)-N7)-methyltransferase TrmB [Candidatus Dojkabacteria bacterium]HQF36868.1 tRNA (guanosine(46)-N7)-methyltransferase TrmB [Candidatus Dojkabacteria bacterium]